MPQSSQGPHNITPKRLTVRVVARLPVDVDSRLRGPVTAEVPGDGAGKPGIADVSNTAYATATALRFNDGVNGPSPSAPPRRTRRIVLVSLAFLGLASAAFAVRGPLMMPAARCMAGRWHGCLDTVNGVLLMMLVGLPLAALVVWALARRRLATGVTSAWQKSLAEVGTVYWTVPWVWLTLMPGSGAGIVPGRVSLVPLRDLVTMSPLGIGGNLLVFAALGFFAPMRFAALASVPRIVALGAGCSVLIETAQYVFQLDRVSSVDDVLVNVAGVVLAALASRHWWRTTAQVPSDQPRPAPAPAG